MQQYVFQDLPGYEDVAKRFAQALASETVDRVQNSNFDLKDAAKLVMGSVITGFASARVIADPTPLPFNANDLNQVAGECKDWTQKYKVEDASNAAEFTGAQLLQVFCNRVEFDAKRAATAKSASLTSRSASLP